MVTIAGGGGAGATDYAADNSTPILHVSGGSGGNLSSYPLMLLPGENITISVGIGAPSTTTALMAAGGTTSFGGYLSCTGGKSVMPGDCGANGGLGNRGMYVVTQYAYIIGAKTPMIYGSGGNVSRCNGCAGIYPTSGAPGDNGVVIVDVFY